MYPLLLKWMTLSYDTFVIASSVLHESPLFSSPWSFFITPRSADLHPLSDATALAWQLNARACGSLTFKTLPLSSLDEAFQLTLSHLSPQQTESKSNNTGQLPAKKIVFSQFEPESQKYLKQLDKAIKTLKSTLQNGTAKMVIEKEKTKERI